MLSDPVVTVLCAYVALVGWMVAIYQQSRAKRWRRMHNEQRRKYNRLLRKRRCEAIEDIVARIFGGGD